MPIYAHVKDNVVVNTIVAEIDVIDLLPNKNEFVLTDGTVSIDSNYDGVNFIAPQPYPSWVLNENKKWEAPVTKPSDNKNYVWFELNRQWIELV